ncbi:7-cyano-7-deazaguanine synthase [Paraburkholderia caledonica]|jgi:7-cyano-7-deazaguanine synthase|uniref:7-cyano-7-deazaguanine synthase n=1 Tax=Paraburkholderia caledonica TaxID=134536 RepID=UPI000DEFF22D|nr:7-cyano-7-deazaguanine synthase [Paraburkholderia caledonica]AXF13532.1 hypothetical protein CUJ87_03160 [Paraburkholderia caledonica]
MVKFTHAVLLSGGLDSTVLLHQFHSQSGQKIRAINVNGGNASWLHQLHYSKANCNELGIPIEPLDLRGFQQLMAGYVPPELAGIDDFDSRCPYDGSILPVVMACAAYHCQISDTPMLLVGLTKEQSNPNTINFLKTLGNALSLFDPQARPVSIEAPFLSLTKSQVVQRGVQLGMDFSKTWSCFMGGSHHCGVCGPCVNRKDAFAAAAVADPTTYIA